MCSGGKGGLGGGDHVVGHGLDRREISLCAVDDVQPGHYVPADHEHETDGGISWRLLSTLHVFERGRWKI